MIDKIPVLLSRFAFAAPLTLGAGILASYAMAPTNWWFALFVAFPVLYLTLHHADNKKRAFALGWLFGFGYFVFGLSWIGNALLVEGNPYKWAWPLAVSGLPTLLAFFTGFAGLACRFADLKRLSGFAVFVGAFFAAEFLRGHLFTGFPWNLYGYTWADHLDVLQILSLGNIYLLTALTIFWSSALGFILLNPRLPGLLIFFLALASFSGVVMYGAKRLISTELNAHDRVQIRMVQPNITQAEKWDSRKVSGHFAKLLEMSAYDGTPSDGKLTYIVWPETAIRDWFIKDRGALNAIRAMLQSYPDGAVLFTGILLHDEEQHNYSNALVMIDNAGNISNIYSKHHLVPFGEYIPFQDYIPLEPVARFKGMTAGDGLKTYQTPEGLSYSPLVCYEILFPGRSIKTDTRPDFIINVTNDAWYGISAGPYQHFIQAQFRAIETGIPVIRVANTGFTGIFDPLGHNIGMTDLFKDEVQTVTLPYTKPSASN